MTTASIPFIQYLRPNGRRADVSISRPDAVAEKAQAIIAAGYRFECEELASGHVSLTVSDDDGDYAFEVCMNGPDVPGAVDKLIRSFDLNRNHRASAA